MDNGKSPLKAQKVSEIVLKGFFVNHKQNEDVRPRGQKAPKRQKPKPMKTLWILTRCIITGDSQHA